MIIADGVSPDSLAHSIDSGHLPALAALREEGQLSTITSAFPSVTGPAYAPFLMGRYPPSLGALSVIWRGLRRRERIGQSAAFVARAAATHFRGNVRGWLAIDRQVGEEAARRLRTQRVKFA